MEYHGKLYGKIGHRFFDTGKTSKDFDKLERDNSKMLEMLEKLTSINPIHDGYHELKLKAINLIKEATKL